MDNKINIIPVPFYIDNKNYGYDHSVVSYKDGDPEKPRVGTLAFEEEEYLVKNIKQVMKYNTNYRSRPSTWKEANYIYNENMKLENFPPDLPFHSFKSLIKGIVINQIGSFLQLYNKEKDFGDMDLLFGIPVFSNVEGMEGKEKNNFKEEYKNNIKLILKRLNIKNKVHFLYEPFAIIRHAIEKKLMNFTEKVSRLLIIDFGGSTFNCCVVSTTNEGKLAEGNKYKNVFGTNYKPWGCSTVDKFILENIVRQKISHKNYKFSNKDFHKAELLKILISNDIKQGKSGPWRLELEAIQEEITITRTDFEDLIIKNIWPGLKSTLNKTIEDAKGELSNSFEQVDFVLFAGGGSNLPFLREFFEADFANKIRSTESIIMIDHPHLAVASGLAIDAMCKLNKTEEILSDDEYLENDLFMDLSSRGKKVEMEIKNRLLVNSKWDDSGKIIDKNLMKKQDIIKNTNSYDKKPWEIKLKEHFDYNRLDYTFFENAQKESISQVERSHFQFHSKPDRKKYDMDFFLDTDENGIVSPKIRWKDGEVLNSHKPFELWSYTPSKEMFAIDLGNSTTSIFMITDNPNFKKVDLADSMPISDIKKIESITIKDTESHKIGITESELTKSSIVSQVLNETAGWKEEILSKEKLYNTDEFMSINNINRELIESWIKKWEELGIFYDYKTVSQVIVTFQSNKIPVLYGPPGFGKSKLLELIAEETKSYFNLIPVKPNWRDSSALFNNNGELSEFQRTIFISTIYMEYNKINPVNCIVCFDEMNLSHPEYYMSELLSLLELDERMRVTDIKGERFPILSNLLIAGTINVDHTTKILSPKLKNRVKFIKFGDIKIRLDEKLKFNLDRKILESSEFMTFSELLITFNDCLHLSGINISYRILDYFNKTIIIQTKNKLLSGSYLYDYLLTSSVIPSLDFNKFSKNHEMTIVQISKNVLSNPELEKIFPDFIGNLKRIVEDYTFSTISGGLL